MKKYIISLIFLLVAGTAKTQTATPLAQYAGNQIIYNPGFAGTQDLFSANLSVKKLWVGIPNSPSLISLNAHAPFQNLRNALGFVYQREEWGPQVLHTTNVTYAYKVHLSTTSFLSLGVQAGILHASTDWDMVDFVKDEGDPGHGEGKTSAAGFDANFGAYFQTQNFYLGLSARHLTLPRIDRVRVGTEEANEVFISRMRMQFFFIGGYNFEIDDQWAIRPHALVRYQRYMPITTSIGATVAYSERLFFGVGYMTGQHAVSLNFALEVVQGLRIGYSYDMLFGRLRPFQRGSHEISINYFLPLWDKTPENKAQQTYWL